MQGLADLIVASYANDVRLQLQPMPTVVRSNERSRKPATLGAGCMLVGSGSLASDPDAAVPYQSIPSAVVRHHHAASRRIDTQFGSPNAGYVNPFIRDSMALFS